jgi:NADP-dependent 3-hydroxy acid dehydrogenase YdfG
VKMGVNLEGKSVLITPAPPRTSARPPPASRREDRLNDLARELGDHALPIPADVSDEEACEKLVEKAVERFGTLDVLVNDAGLGINVLVVEGESEK